MSAVPRHLAVIPDGNRRWARARGLSPQQGHLQGIANVGPIAGCAWTAGVEVFSFWWGSPANLTRRAPEEVEAIVGVLNRWLVEEAPALLAAHDAQFDVFGRWEQHCPSLAEGIAAARQAAGSGPRRLVLLMAYDGRDELVDAARTGPTTREALAANLWTASLPPVDLVLRTAGEPHLSAGFLLWHIAEAQLAFLDEPWPALTPARLECAITNYGETERRFGQ